MLEYKGTVRVSRQRCTVRLVDVLMALRDQESIYVRLVVSFVEVYQPKY